MFKWKVSTLGSSVKRSKSSTSQKLNNATEEDRKHAAEEEQFHTQETTGYDYMAQQPASNLVSTGYYPSMIETHNPMSPALPHKQFHSMQDYSQENGYAVRQNGTAYHTLTMRQFSQQHQVLPDLGTESLYPPMQDPSYRMSPAQDASFRHYSIGQPSSAEVRNHSGCEAKQVERGISPSDNAQAQAYLAWVNWQLQKRPGTTAIQDLSELRDDKLLAILVQIVSSKPLIGLDSRPPTQAVCLINMERILAHLAKQRVKVATITPHDLAGGNVKAIMKLIQSLAASYKPHSVGSGRGRTSAQATPDLSQPSNRKLSEVSMTTTTNGQPSMGLTVRAVATLRRPPKAQPYDNKTDGARNDFIQQKKLNLSTESIDRNMVNAQIQASLRKSESSAQTVLTGSRQMNPAGKNPIPVAAVPATPLVTRSARIDRKPSSAEKTRSGSMPPMKNLPITALPPQEVVKPIEQKSGNPPVKRSESRAVDSAKKLQLSRSNSAAIPKIAKMDGKSKSESLLRKNDEKKETPFKFWENLKDKGRRKLPDSPKTENQIDEKPLDLSAEDSPAESCKGTSKSGSRGNLTPLEIRGEVEGSSNNTSPVTSDHEEAHMRQASFGTMPRIEAVGPKVDVYDRMEKKLHEVQKWLFQTVMVDPAGKLEPERNREEVAPNVPYDVVLRDLHTARNQLMELQSLLLSASSDVGQQEQQTVITDSRGTNTAFAEEMDSYGVLKPVAIENLKLADVLPEDASPEKLRQALMKSALRQHRLSTEKAELQKKLEEKEWQLNELRKNMSSPRLLDTSGNSSTLAPATPQMNRRSRGREELQIARDALTSLRSNFRNEDPNQHTIDTLEQCISMLLERLTTSEQPSFSPFSKGSDGSGTARRPISSHHGSPETTKALYFTERSLTPFLVVLQGRLGEVTLRDFKMALDRSTRYRFMFKTPDPEYGFVKQELSDDDAILPGFDGKIVAWLEEDC